MKASTRMSFSGQALLVATETRGWLGMSHPAVPELLDWSLLVVSPLPSGVELARLTFLLTAVSTTQVLVPAQAADMISQTAFLAATLEDMDIALNVVSLHSI